MAGFVETLGGAHRLLGRKAELARGLHLQGGGHEGCGGAAGGGLGLDRGDGEVARADRLHRHVGGGFVGKVEAVELAAGQLDEVGLEGLSAGGEERDAHGPVFAGPEGLDLHLAFDDEPKADGLHAAGGFRAGQLAPEHGGEVEADEIVERPAREVGIDQRLIDVAGIVHRLSDGSTGDGVEGDATDRGIAAQRLAVAQGLGEVPGNRLAFAVGVGGEDERGVVLQRVGDGLEVLAAVGVDLPEHGKVLVGIDRAVLGGQVSDMAIGGEHGIVAAQVAVDGLGLGGRFDDNDGHGGPWLRGGRSGGPDCAARWAGGRGDVNVRRAGAARPRHPGQALTAQGIDSAGRSGCPSGNFTGR